MGCDGKLVRLGNGEPPPDASMPDSGPDRDAVGGSAAGAGGNAGGGAGGAPCPHANVAAEQILWIGDGWVVSPGAQHTEVRDLARASGAIGPTDDYAVQAANGATMSAIVDQYGVQEAMATKVKVLIMDGGTIDAIATDGSAASVSSVAATFGQLLSTIAADGTVQQIVYFLVPELPSIPGVATLRPVLQQACAKSTVPCYFVDLQGQLTWTDHPDYTAGNGILPTDAGAQMIANLIWSTMQQNCIAQ